MGNFKKPCVAKMLAHAHKSKLFHSKVSAGFLRKDLQSSCSLGKIQNLGGRELSE